MNVVAETSAPELSDLADLPPGELALEAETADIVARFTRSGEIDADGSEAVRVAAFNSFI